MNKQSPRSEFGVNRRDLISALRKLRRGDFTVRLPEDGPEADSEIAILFNEVVSLNQQLTDEFERLSRVVGKEGKIGHRAKVRGATGGWDTKLRAVNELIDDMVQPTTEVARVIGAVAKGDLPQSMAVEIDGLDTIRSAVSQRPSIHALLMTGYADEDAVADAREYVPVIRKPIDLDS